jgi:hypothetical protein
MTSDRLGFEGELSEAIGGYPKLRKRLSEAIQDYPGRCNEAEKRNGLVD